MPAHPLRKTAHLNDNPKGRGSPYKGPTSRRHASAIDVDILVDAVSELPLNKRRPKSSYVHPPWCPLNRLSRGYT